jgi:hypothetical protein
MTRGLRHLAQLREQAFEEERAEHAAQHRPPGRAGTGDDGADDGADQSGLPVHGAGRRAAAAHGSARAMRFMGA